MAQVVYDGGPPVTQERGAGAAVPLAATPAGLDASQDARVAYGPVAVGAAAITITLIVRGGQAGNVTRQLAPGMSTIICGAAYNGFYAGQTNTALVYEVGPHGSFFPDAGSGSVAPRGQTTQVATAVLGPTTVASATSLTVGSAGNNTVTVGSIVFFNLSAYVVSTTAEALGYVCIVGHTSGTMYVVAFPTSAVAGSFPMTATAEKLDVSYANAFGVSIAVSGVYWAVSP